MREIIVVSRIDGLPSHNDIGKLVERCSGLPVLVVNIQKDIADKARRQLLAVLELSSESLRQMTRSNGLGNSQSIKRLVPAYRELQDILADSLNREGYNFLNENLPRSYRFIGDFPWDWLEIHGIPLGLAAPSSQCFLPEYYDNMAPFPLPLEGKGKLTAETLIRIGEIQRIRLLGVKYSSSFLSSVHGLAGFATKLLTKFSEEAEEEYFRIIGGFKEYDKHSVEDLLKQPSRYLVFLGHASHEGILLSDGNLLRVNELPDVLQYGSAILLACGTGLTIGDDLSLAQYFHTHGARDTLAIQLPFATLLYIEEQLITLMSDLIRVEGLHPRFPEIAFITRFSLMYTFFFRIISLVAQIPIKPNLKVISPYEADYDRIYRDRWGIMWHAFRRDIMNAPKETKAMQISEGATIWDPIFIPLKAIGLSITYLQR